ncbi:MAG: hypothetical protein EXR84_08825 [Gammaproteobacteria bacterium]|nr:hypothetical protein [Gammaproteobacteria bacterium]
MQDNVIHVGLDVDDSNYHGSAFNQATGEVIDFQCRPTLKGLLNQLDKLRKHFAEHVIKLCYEASYIGFTLQRDLTEKGFHCEVVAPNSIPRLQGKQIKTDRLDAIDLARCYANDLLTLVAVPEREQEQDQDLLRSRHKIMVHQSDVRRHIHSLLRRNGLHFKEQTRFKSHWTKAHYFWLDKELEKVTEGLKNNPSVTFNFALQKK